MNTLKVWTKVCILIFNKMKDYKRLLVSISPKFSYSRLGFEMWKWGSENSVWPMMLRILLRVGLKITGYCRPTKKNSATCLCPTFGTRKRLKQEGTCINNSVQQIARKIIMNLIVASMKDNKFFLLWRKEQLHQSRNKVRKYYNDVENDKSFAQKKQHF